MLLPSLQYALYVNNNRWASSAPMSFEVEISRIDQRDYYSDGHQGSALSSSSSVIHRDTEDTNRYYASDNNQSNKLWHRLDKVHRAKNSRRPSHRWPLGASRSKLGSRFNQQQSHEPKVIPGKPIFNPDVDQSPPSSGPGVPDSSKSSQKSADVLLLPNLQGPSEGLYYGLIDSGVPGKPIFTLDANQHPSSVEGSVVPTGVPIFTPDVQLQQPQSYSEHSQQESIDAVTPNSVNELQSQQHYATDDYNAHYETTTSSYSSYPRPTRKCTFSTTF